MMLRVIILLAIVQFIFSLWPILVKFVIDDGASAAFIAIVRDIFASVALW
jgi:hypothetical protein